MIMQIVAVHDRAAQGYARPVFVAALGQAIRSFQDELNRQDPNNEMNRHPDDFDLFHLGTYNDSTGKIESLEVPLQIAIGKQLVNR